LLTLFLFFPGCGGSASPPAAPTPSALGGGYRSADERAAFTATKILCASQSGVKDKAAMAHKVAVESFEGRQRDAAEAGCMVGLDAP
jgi:hypothetical protein